MTTIELQSTFEPKRHRRFTLRPYASLVPPSTVLLLFFALPMGMMIGMSFHGSDDQAWTIANYQRFFADDLMMAGLARTMLMSGLVAICVTVMAYPLAYYLARSTSRWRLVVFALAIAPELAGVVLRTYGWLVILEDRGFVNSMLLWAGLISEPLPLSRSMFGVVAGLTHVVLPFGVLSLMTSLQGINPNLEKAAQVLGLPVQPCCTTLFYHFPFPGSSAPCSSLSQWRPAPMRHQRCLAVRASRCWQQWSTSRCFLHRLAVCRRDGECVARGNTRCHLHRLAH